MSKGILVMDMPESCAKCDLCVLHSDYVSLEYECRGTKIFNGYVKVHSRIDRKLLNKKQDWCPLREVPKKVDFINEYQDDADLYSDDFSIGYSKGFNACIDGMLGN